MKLYNYFRQLKKFIVLPKQFMLKGIKNPYYYSYYRKIFLKFLLCGLFKNEIQIKFGTDYWKHVPKYLFSDIPGYFYDFVYYKLNMFYDNKIKHKNVQHLKPSKPYSPRSKRKHIYVEESILENIAKMAGFEIIYEELGIFKSIYTISLQ